LELPVDRASGGRLDESAASEMSGMPAGTADSGKLGGRIDALQALRQGFSVSIFIS
jgi:hypothetical protein